MTEKRIFLETPRKLMSDIPWDPIRKVSLFLSLMIYLGTIGSTVALGNPIFEWGWWWLWFGLFLTTLPFIMGRVACGWFCPYAAIHDIFLGKLRYRRLNWPKELAANRFLILFLVLGVLATLEIFWEWDFFIWYSRAFLIASVLWGLLFPPRDWCRYICPLGTYAQLYARVRVLGVRVDPELCMRCARCPCEDSCMMGVRWREEVVGGTWITPDYCVVCMNCANACPFGAVYAWRVH